VSKKATQLNEVGDRYVVIFDGVCNLCNGVVDFIIKRDPKGQFCFTPMQSDLAKELATQYYDDKNTIDTLLLIKNGDVYVRTNAALEIAKDLSGYWALLRMLRLLPRPVRDFLYRIVARNRYSLFGKRKNCRVPTKDLLNRFVGI